MLDKCYFTVGSSHFRQLIGIAVGLDPAPFMVTLFLYYYERKLLLQTKKRDLQKAIIFSNILRFTDDLCSFINKEFGNQLNDIYIYIYPDKLKLTKVNEDSCKASFLDLSIEFHDRKVATELFNERYVFSFYISCMPYFDSNIPFNIFCAYRSWNSTYCPDNNRRD